MGSTRIVIIGGVAAGTKAAAKARRLNQNAEITVIERGQHLSYAGCGLPYYLSGVVKEQDELMATGTGIVRDSEYFKNVKGFTVLNLHEALSIDRTTKQVTVQDLRNDKTFQLPYDKLILATGSTPFVPPIPGSDLKGIHCLQKVEDAVAIRTEVERNKARRVGVIGGGLISLEAAENLVEIGCQVTVVEVMPQILGFLDEDMALLVQRRLEAGGVQVFTGGKVRALEGENGRVCAIVTEKRRIPVDMVIMAAGVRPNVQLAREAGLDIGETGAIAVDRRMATSDPEIFAVGDCVENRCLVCQKNFYAYTPMGSTANKHGRVAAINACGGNEYFNGIVQTGILKVFDYNVGRAGLTEAGARREGFDPVSVITAGSDKAHFYPTARLLIIKLVADRKTGRILGIQLVGPGEVDKRLNAVAAALAYSARVEDFSNVDMAYAPPYSPAVDNLIVTANALRNKLEGAYRGLGPLVLKQWMDKGEDVYLLDVRDPEEHQRRQMPGATLIPLDQVRQRHGEVPRDRRVVAFCTSSLRAYEAALILKHHGHLDVWVLDGGLAAWPFELQEAQV